MKIKARVKNHYEIFLEIIRLFLDGKFFLSEQYFKAPERRIVRWNDEHFIILQPLRMIEFHTMGDTTMTWKMDDFRRFTIKQIYDYMYEDTSTTI